MRPNVIILTGGYNGSSVLTGLLARAGFWLGNSTAKVRYETFENQKLVDLNIKLLKSSGFRWNDVTELPPPSIVEIEKLSLNLSVHEFERLVHECNSNKPWLWKDPRLCYTIFFWRRFIDLDRCRFILMTRDIKQTWTSAILKGSPISFGGTKKYTR